MRHLPAIDGLRAIAVLSVVAYHAGLPVPAGFVGVDIFFVISGYLITRLLNDELRDTGRIDFLHFYARRARRILPAVTLVILVTLALSWMLLPTGKADVAQSAAAAGLFVANLFFQAATGDYWSSSAEMMPLLHLWSLSIEEQFYLLWPLLLVAVRRRPLPWLAGVALASLAVAEMLLWSNPTAAFYQTPARAWELAAGGLIAVRPLPAWRWSTSLGLALIGLAIAVPTGHFPGAGALPAVAGAAVLINAVHRGARIPLLEVRPMVWIGLISYSLYLWHWPLLAIDRATRIGDAPMSTRLTLCIVAVVLATLSYRYVETPFRRVRSRPGRAVAMGVGCLAVLAGCAFAVGAHAPPGVKPPTFKPMVCDPTAIARIQPARCFTTERKVLLWGDSFAGVWTPYVEQLARQEQLPLALYFRTGCYPTAGEAVPRRDDAETRLCRQHNDRVLAWIKSNGAEVVVLASYYTEFFRNHPGHPGLADLVREISPYVRRIVIIGPTPELRDTPQRCQALRIDCDVELAEFRSASAEIIHGLAAIARMPKVEVVDPSPFFCPDGSCPITRDGVLLYSDAVHVSREASALFVQGL